MGDSSVDPDHHRHSSPYELFGHVGAIIIASFASSTSTSWENARALLVPLLAILLIFLLLVICCLTSLVLREAGLIRKARKEDDARQPALSESDKVVFAEMDADGDGVIRPPNPGAPRDQGPRDRTGRLGGGSLEGIPGEPPEVGYASGPPPRAIRTGQ
ncbi:unnamed protein product [Prorocentrum cordatum]|uniref:EF-hand domain-containing protein n=1 Tax=Prorocentrum cordatum TaxID=2364126 RepID=A0ABN9RUP4_9DINO|nr:unnamed protein product [Polarella glacialis]